MQDRGMNDEKRRELWNLATKKNGWGADSIAEQIGSNGKALDAIVRRGSKRSKIAPTLDVWLLENSHKLASGHSVERKPTDVLEVVCGVLGGIIDTIRLDDATRAEKASITLNQLQLLVSQYGRQLQEISSQDE